MKKRQMITILVLLFLISLSKQVFAYEHTYVRIGLNTPIKSKNTVKLTGDGFEIGIWEKGPSKLFDISDEILFANLDSYYTKIDNDYIKTDGETDTITHGLFHLKTNKSYYSYDEALAEVEELRGLGIEAFVYYNQGYFEIWIGQFTSEDIALDEASQYQDEVEIIQADDNKISFTNERNEIILMFDKDQNIYLTSLNSNLKLVSVEDSRYRDYIMISRDKDQIIIINNVLLPHYLYGVVPCEMNYSWPLEALKAQAIVAKNYILTNLNKHGHEGYDLCDKQHCQVYGGYDSENIITNRAVDETIDKILVYNDKLITPYYHASSGGYIESSENVWSGNYPYLKSAEDYYSVGNPYDYWEYVVGKDEINRLLIEKNIDVGSLLDMQIVSRAESGRVMDLMIIGTKGTEIISKENIRNLFGTTKLKSRLFDIEYNGKGYNSAEEKVYVYDLEKDDIVKKSIDGANILTSNGIEVIDLKELEEEIIITDGYNSYELVGSINTDYTDKTDMFIFKGSGFGHGVGMSQWGAKVMAELGYDYSEILQYYYNGTEIK